MNRKLRGQETAGKAPLVVGIDLAGSPSRNTGLCALRGTRILRWRTAHADEEILAFLAALKPALVAIDAPLHLPPGRRTIEERNGSNYRACDLRLRERRIPFFPITLGPMRALTRRGVSLRRKLERQGLRAIEIYPGAAQDLWGIPRKQGGLGRLRRGLARLGLRGLDPRMNGDELDAATGALVGRLFLEGRAEVLGDFRRGAIVIPLSQRFEIPRLRPPTRRQISFRTFRASASGVLRKLR